MKLFTSKKADTFKILNYGFWRLFFIGIVFLTIFLLISSHIKTDIDTSDIRSIIFTQRLLNSELSPSDDSYSGYLDMEKLSGPALSDLYDIDTDLFGASFTVKEFGGNESFDFFINKDWFQRYYPLSKFHKYNGNLRWRYVLLDKKNETLPGLLLIKTVQRKNER